MAASKSLPDRPSLESLRKQAKTLARDRSLSLRDAQLALAREYGFRGWQDLTAEIGRRLGRELERAVARARQVIHDNDVEGLKQLLAEYPELLSWTVDAEDGGLLGMATDAYGDAGDAQREQWFTRAACAELLIDAGAVVKPSVCDGLLQSRAHGLLELFHRKGLLPRTLKFLAALGDLGRVRAALDSTRNDPAAIDEAFVSACRFGHDAVASVLLERSRALDPALDRAAFIKAFSKADFTQVAAHGLARVYAMVQTKRALEDENLAAFVTGLQREPWLLDDASVPFQAELIETASFMKDRGAFIAALLDLDPAVLRRQPPPPSHAIEWAFTYANTHLLPLLTRIWPVPDDLESAAGMGNLARVKQLLDGDDRANAQDTLDKALAFAVINRHFDVADFLLEHGADISTRWNSHEPASILHHLVFLPDPYESMRFLIDRGIDMTIKDYRWNSDAVGWARFGNSDEKMARWLEEAGRQREQRP